MAFTLASSVDATVKLTVKINPSNNGALFSRTAPRFRLKLGTTNTRAEVCSTAFNREQIARRSRSGRGYESLKYGL